jgi:hypothetical protein
MIVDRHGTSTPKHFFRTADAEQAKATGGMIALIPRTDYAQLLAVPGGEPVEDLHMTMAYLGKDVTGMDPTGLQAALDTIQSYFGPVETTVFGYGAFNPSDAEDGCAVYMVQGTDELRDLHEAVERAVRELFPPIPEAYPVWIPHLTAKYGLPTALNYQGPVVFDRLRLAFAGQDFDFSL